MSATRNVTRDTKVSIDGDEPLTVAEFVEANEFDADETDELLAGLAREGAALFGGGAGPLVIVRLV